LDQQAIELLPGDRARLRVVVADDLVAAAFRVAVMDLAGVLAAINIHHLAVHGCRGHPRLFVKGMLDVKQFGFHVNFHREIADVAMTRVADVTDRFSTAQHRRDLLLDDIGGGADQHVYVCICRCFYTYFPVCVCILQLYIYSVERRILDQKINKKRSNISKKKK